MSTQNSFRVYDLSQVSLGINDRNELRQRGCKLGCREGIWEWWALQQNIFGEKYSNQKCENTV